MGAETAKRKKGKSDIPQKPPGSKGKRKRGERITRAQFLELATHYIITGVKEHACIAAGITPLSARYVFSLPLLQELIAELRPEVEKRTKEKAIAEGVKKFEMTADFVDMHVSHIIANGKTHFMRGDSDRVKACEVAYKRLGLIEAAKIVNNNQANAQAIAQGKTLKEVYKSRWLIEKEQRLATQFEKEHAALPETTA